MSKVYEYRVVFGEGGRTATGGAFLGTGPVRHLEAEDKVDAFEQIYNSTKANTDGEITALKTDFQDRMLGFTEEEFDRVAAIPDMRIREGFPQGKGAQIEFIREMPN